MRLRTGKIHPKITTTGHAPVTRALDCVAERLMDALNARAGGVHVAEVRIGLVYTGVQLDDGSLGVALTLPPPLPGDCHSHVEALGSLAGCAAVDLLAGLRATDPVARAVGLATANALANRPAPGQQPGDVRTRLKLRPTDRVAMVGHFKPLVADLDAAAATLTIFELIDRPQGRLRPAREALDVLPTCDVALVTATALVSDTLDAILQAARGCRQVAILGASTPLVPEAFARAPVTVLCGVIAREPAPVLQAISEAAGMRRFKPYLDKVSIAL